jgi:hypothetical protein
VYLKTLDVKHLAVFLYDRRVDNRVLYKNLVQIAPIYDIVVYPFEFGVNHRNETYKLDDAIEELKESGINYIIGYLHNWEMNGYVEMNRLVLDKLIDEGLLANPDYYWIFQEDFYFQFDESYRGVFLPMDEKLATAINNTAILTVRGVFDTAENTQMDESVFQLVHDADFWPYFDSIRQEREMDATRSIPFSVDSLDYWISTLSYVIHVLNSLLLSNRDEGAFQLVHDADFWPYFDSIRQEREMDATRSTPFSVDPLDYWISTLWYVLHIFNSLLVSNRYSPGTHPLFALVHRLYDAVMSYGLAACQTSNETMFTGPELYERIMKLDFMGASGTVNFDTTTGLRDPRAVEFILANVVSYNATALHEEQNSTGTFNNTGGDFAQNSTYTSTSGDFAAKYVPKIIIQPFAGKVVTHEELLLPSGSMSPTKPKVNPRIVYKDLVPVWANGVCWAFAGLVLLLSLGFGGWTLLHLDHPRIKASQPIFLIPLCLGKSSRFHIPFDSLTHNGSSLITPLSCYTHKGTFLIACSTVVSTFQEDIISNVDALSILCMLNVWLLVLGT